MIAQSKKRKKGVEGEAASVIPMQQGLDPIIGENPHTLILGMFPSKKSREMGNPPPLSLSSLSFLSHLFNSGVLWKAK